MGTRRLQRLESICYCSPQIFLCVNCSGLCFFLLDKLQENLKRLNETIVTLHANYLSGNAKKMNRMKEYGFWLATTDENGAYTNKCADYVPHVSPAPALAVSKH